MIQEKSRILVVEDEAITVMDLKRRLKFSGYNVIASVNNGLDAVMKAEKEKPDIILMDVKLTGKLNGMDAAEIIENDLDIPIIFITAFASEIKIGNKNKRFPYCVLSKPFDFDELKRAISMILEEKEVE